MNGICCALRSLIFLATTVFSAASTSMRKSPGNSTAHRVLHVAPEGLKSFGVYWVHTPKSGSSFGLAVLQACDPDTFRAMRNRPTNNKLDSVTSPHFSGFCNDW